MMIAGHGKSSEQTKGLSLEVMSANKKNMVSVKNALNSLAMHLLSLWLVIMVTQITNYIDMKMFQKTC